MAGRPGAGKREGVNGALIRQLRDGVFRLSAVEFVNSTDVDDTTLLQAERDGLATQAVRSAIEARFVTLLKQQIVLESKAAALTGSDADPNALSPIHDTDTIYQTIREIVSLIDAEPPSSSLPRSDKRFWIASVHGLNPTGYPKNVDLSANSVASLYAKSFGDTVARCITNDWDVRTLYHIAQLDRFEQIRARCLEHKDRKNLQVRAYCFARGLALQAPLIIGSSNSFVGYDHPNEYRVRAVLHLKGRSPATLQAEYFLSLWNSTGVYQLRDESGVNEEEMSRLENDVRRLS